MKSKFLAVFSATFQQHQWVSYTVHGTHKPYFSITFLLKIDLTVLFTYLKIILLQYFSFQQNKSWTLSPLVLLKFADCAPQSIEIMLFCYRQPVQSFPSKTSGWRYFWQHNIYKIWRGSGWFAIRMTLWQWESKGGCGIFDDKWIEGVSEILCTCP